MKSIGIAGAAGAFKGVFVHGVLSAFESAGLLAQVYGGASSATIAVALAATGQAKSVGLEYWENARECLLKCHNNMNQASLQIITEYSPRLSPYLFLPNRPRLIIAASAVISAEAAQITQGEQAQRLGRRLLVAALRRNPSWVEQHLKTHLFDSASSQEEHKLNQDNFIEIAYATTRMLHEGDPAAWVNQKPLVDASYTCSCPAVELAQLGCDRVIAIATEPGELYRNLFGTEIIPSMWQNVAIKIVKPDLNLKELGVDFTSASNKGFELAYQHGQDKGQEFIKKEMSDK